VRSLNELTRVAASLNEAAEALQHEVARFRTLEEGV
jgi:methyl-accepting chemotaxis protein